MPGPPLDEVAVYSEHLMVPVHYWAELDAKLYGILISTVHEQVRAHRTHP
jgi:hypothetical protein